MKYLEELGVGEFFLYKNTIFLKTIDFRNRKGSDAYFCINIDNGSGQWVECNQTVELIELYKRDTDGNILAIKDRKNSYEEYKKNTNI